jgi:hypothetical protein
MRTLIVYEPAGAGIDRITHEVAQGLATYLETEVVVVERALGRLDRDVALLVLGAPTTSTGLSRHWTRVPEQRRRTSRSSARRAGLRDWLALLPWASDAPPTAVFDVAGDGRDGVAPRSGRSAAVEVARTLRRRRYDAVAEPVTFAVGTSDTGLEAEAGRARDWGAEIARAALATRRRRRRTTAPRAVLARA